MIFFYSPIAGNNNLIIEGKEFHYLFNVRRTKENEIVKISNLKDGFLYYYRTTSIRKKEARLELFKKIKPEDKKNNTHLGWCTVDINDIQKTLPFLNEIGVEKISFLNSQRSQGKRKIPYEKLNKILIQSCQQCGRNSLMQLEENSLENFLNQNPNSLVLDFEENISNTEIKKNSITSGIIGPEGGFSETEKKLFEQKKSPIKKCRTHILKSETAAIYAAIFLLEN